MNKNFVWIGSVICVLGILMYLFICLSNPTLWLVIAGIGLIVAIIGLLQKNTSAKKKNKK